MVTAAARVNVAVAVSLSVMPDLKARAFKVVVALNVSGAVYCVDEAVGVVPLVV